MCNNAIATLHAKNGFGITADGVFFSKTEGMLRYEMPLLILCGIGITIMVARMIRDLRKEQKAKRAARMQSFDAPADVEASQPAITVGT